MATKHTGLNESKLDLFQVNLEDLFKRLGHEIQFPEESTRDVRKRKDWDDLLTNLSNKAKQFLLAPGAQSLKEVEEMVTLIDTYVSFDSFLVSQEINKL